SRPSATVSLTIRTVVWTPGARVWPSNAGRWSGALGALVSTGGPDTCASDWAEPASPPQPATKARAETAAVRAGRRMGKTSESESTTRPPSLPDDKNRHALHMQARVRRFLSPA